MATGESRSNLSRHLNTQSKLLTVCTNSIHTAVLLWLWGTGGAVFPHRFGLYVTTLKQHIQNICRMLSNVCVYVMVSGWMDEAPFTHALSSRLYALSAGAACGRCEWGPSRTSGGFMCDQCQMILHDLPWRRHATGCAECTERVVQIHTHCMNIRENCCHCKGVGSFVCQRCVVKLDWPDYL